MEAVPTCVDVLVGERLGEPSTAEFHSLELLASSDAPRQARLFARAASLPLAEDDLSLLSLLTSELVTNAVLHARTPMSYCLVVTEELVLVVVGDSNPALPEPSTEVGRGLRLVANLASSWGIRPAASAGKAVWFTLDRTRG